MWVSFRVPLGSREWSTCYFVYTINSIHSSTSNHAYWKWITCTPDYTAVVPLLYKYVVTNTWYEVQKTPGTHSKNSENKHAMGQKVACGSAAAVHHWCDNGYVCVVFVARAYRHSSSAYGIWHTTAVYLVPVYHIIRASADRQQAFAHLRQQQRRQRQ